MGRFFEVKSHFRMPIAETAGHDVSVALLFL